MTKSSKKMLLIGCGNMGYAILTGIINSEIYDKSNIIVSDKSEFCRKRAEDLGVTALENPGSALDSDLIILAVKPNALDLLSADIADSVNDQALIVSILAGKTIKTLEEKLPRCKKIIRVMPNTPALVGSGMSGICRSENVSQGEMDEILSIFSSFGKAYEVGEDMMDTVTGISGSGPAYAFMFIDGLAKAGVKNGMSEDEAKIFAAQTVFGAAEMVLSSSDSPEQLKINVCSPGGTTIEAVKVFEESGLYDIIDKAVAACIDKSRRMGKSE